VLDPVAGEDVDLAIGELDRDLHGDLAVRRPEDSAQVVRELQVVGRDVEVVADDLEVRDLGPLARLGLAPRLGLDLRLLDRLRGLVDLVPLAYRLTVNGLRLGHPFPPESRLAGPVSHNFPTREGACVKGW
jgi:hypothetical protein